jgi:hypothetical protein
MFIWRAREVVVHMVKIDVRLIGSKSVGLEDLLQLFHDRKSQSSQEWVMTEAEIIFFQVTAEFALYIATPSRAAQLINQFESSVLRLYVMWSRDTAC